MLPPLSAPAKTTQLGGGGPPLPEIFSTLAEVEAELRRRGSPPDDVDDAIAIGLRQEVPREPGGGGGRGPVPHLFLHFDVNETILLGDPAGGDSVEDCLNKIIAKSAFVRTSADGRGGPDGGPSGVAADAGGPGTTVRRTPSSGDVSPTGTHGLEPTRWWDGTPLDGGGGEVEGGGADPPPPPPLYTGWTWPPGTCPYYRTARKRHARGFTSTRDGRAYRPLYLEMRRRLASGGSDGGDAFSDLVPSFFEALRFYFPPASAAGGSGADGPAVPVVPGPAGRPRVTLVLRTFGTDLPLVARCISEFARGNHPRHGDYVNRDLMLDEDGLFRSSWSRRGAGDADSAGTGTAAEEKGWVYELHRCAGSGDDGGKNEGGKTADRVVGDVEVLDFLQSKSIVGIQDNYPFWRDHNHEPWSGKPVWVTSRGGRYDHHHVLLDDNIHNDPADGAGGIRVEGNDGSFRSLPGEEALGLHGRHLVRVPTVRAVMEDDWFIRQIEDARRRLLNDSLH